jgi:hypothetical protein
MPASIRRTRRNNVDDLLGCAVSVCCHVDIAKQMIDESLLVEVVRQVAHGA